MATIKPTNTAAAAGTRRRRRPREGTERRTRGAGPSAPAASVAVAVAAAAILAGGGGGSFSSAFSSASSARHSGGSRARGGGPLPSSGRPPVDRQADDECLLLPEANADPDLDATSLGGVPYASVAAGIDALYPPHELSLRNAKSRTDGYWTYVARGEDPPREYTYGEFDVDFFARLLDGAWGHYVEGIDDDGDGDGARGEEESREGSAPWANRTFCDIGSGAGRLVFAAAALHPAWGECRGLEILEGLHEAAEAVAEGCRVGTDERTRLGLSEDATAQILRMPRNESDASTGRRADDGREEYLPLAPVRFARGSFADPYERLGDVDCAFVFSSCMGPDLIEELSVAIGRQCRPGTIVITTEFPLHLRGTVPPVEGDDAMPYGPYEIRLLERVDGPCWVMGGSSTAYVHRVERSLSEAYGSGPRERPRPSLEEEAFRLVRSMESGELTDPREFVRRVRNDMVFHGVPPEFLPDIDGDGE